MNSLNMCSRNFFSLWLPRYYFKLCFGKFFSNRYTIVHLKETEKVIEDRRNILQSTLCRGSEIAELVPQPSQHGSSPSPAQLPWMPKASHTAATQIVPRQGQFTLDIRQKFFSMRVLRPCHRLLKEAVDAQSLKVFQARLDGAWRKLVS